MSQAPAPKSPLVEEFKCCGGSDEMPKEHTQDCPDRKSEAVYEFVFLRDIELTKYIQDYGLCDSYVSTYNAAALNSSVTRMLEEALEHIGCVDHRAKRDECICKRCRALTGLAELREKVGK